MDRNMIILKPVAGHLFCTEGQLQTVEAKRSAKGVLPVTAWIRYKFSYIRPQSKKTCCVRNGSLKIAEYRFAFVVDVKEIAPGGGGGTSKIVPVLFTI